MQADFEPALQPGFLDRLTQTAHRCCIIATLLAAAVVVVFVKFKDPNTLAVSTLVASDLAVVLTGIGLVIGYRNARPMRELFGLLFFSLILANVAIYWLLRGYDGLYALRDLLRTSGIVTP